jgi:hypothetical protein
MDEVNDSSMSVLAEGSLKGSPKSYILNKREDTYSKYLIGQKNIYKLIKIENIYKNNLIQPKQFSMFHTIARAKNRIGPHNQDVISIIIGSLLGDSCANNRSGEGTRLSYRQNSIHKDYLF